MVAMNAYWLVVLGIAGLAVLFAVVAVLSAFRVRARLEGEAARREAGSLSAEAASLSAQSSMSDDEAAQIVGVVKNLAAQANLLALNTAIEAARAGEQGGSLVAVAEEAQRLSEHVAQVSKEAAIVSGKAQRSGKTGSPEGLHPHGSV